MARLGGKTEMKNVARGGREYPTFLTCLIMLVTMAALLHTTCTVTGPPGYSLLHFNSLVTRPASILSQLDVVAPAKERPPTLLRVRSGTTSPVADPTLKQVQRITTMADAEPQAANASNPTTPKEQPQLERTLIKETAEISAYDPMTQKDTYVTAYHHADNGGDLHTVNQNPREEIHGGVNGRIHASLPKSKIATSKVSPIIDELQACKRLISEATAESADPSLFSILYKNVTAFSKSYELMEEVFKVYTYRDGHQPLVHSGPLTGIYASEGQFIERMKHTTRFRTDDPQQAHMFFLPYSVQQMVEHLYVPNSRSMHPLASFINEYVTTLSRRYPFWNRTHGADHFFVSCHDWGPATTRNHPELRRNAVKVVCNADASDGLFSLGKDASLPEVYIHHARSKAKVEIGGPGWDERPYLAFFAGQMHGRVRPILLRHWKEKDREMKIYEVLPKSIARNISYAQHMKLSKYCICAMGYEVNSPRIVEAIYSDCVPVIIADNFVLPFSDVLDWDAFSVTVAESEIPNLKRVLEGISEGQYVRMQTRLRKVRRHFVWHEASKKYDVFNMILHSVWASRLNRLEQIRAASSDL